MLTRTGRRLLEEDPEGAARAIAAADQELKEHADLSKDKQTVVAEHLHIVHNRAALSVHIHLKSRCAAATKSHASDSHTILVVIVYPDASCATCHACPHSVERKSVGFKRKS